MKEASPQNLESAKESSMLTEEITVFQFNCTIESSGLVINHVKYNSYKIPCLRMLMNNYDK